MKTATDLFAHPTFFYGLAALSAMVIWYPHVASQISAGINGIAPENRADFVASGEKAVKSAIRLSPIPIILAAIAFRFFTLPSLLKKKPLNTKPLQQKSVLSVLATSASRFSKVAIGSVLTLPLHTLLSPKSEPAVILTALTYTGYGLVLLGLLPAAIACIANSPLFNPENERDKTNESSSPKMR